MQIKHYYFARRKFVQQTSQLQTFTATNNQGQVTDAVESFMFQSCSLVADKN